MFSLKPLEFAKLTFNVVHIYPKAAAKAIYQRLLDMSIFAGYGRASERIHQGDKNVHTFYAAYANKTDGNSMQAVVSIIGVLFGAIHCAGWDFEFPSRVETILWRVSSLLVTAIPLLMVVRYFLYDYEGNTFGNNVILAKFVWPMTVYVGLPLYVFARFILLVLACLALRDLSPSALATVQWSSFLPHI